MVPSLACCCLSTCFTPPLSIKNKHSDLMSKCAYGGDVVCLAPGHMVAEGPVHFVKQLHRLTKVTQHFAEKKKKTVRHKAVEKNELYYSFQ